MHLLSCDHCTNSCALTGSLYLSGACASLISKGDQIIISARYERRYWFSDKLLIRWLYLAFFSPYIINSAFRYTCSLCYFPVAGGARPPLNPKRCKLDHQRNDPKGSCARAQSSLWGGPCHQLGRARCAHRQLSTACHAR
jgi:hypothetical protein